MPVITIEISDENGEGFPMIFRYYTERGTASRTQPALQIANPEFEVGNQDDFLSYIQSNIHTTINATQWTSLTTQIVGYIERDENYFVIANKVLIEHRIQR